MNAGQFLSVFLVVCLVLSIGSCTAVQVADALSHFN